MVVLHQRCARHAGSEFGPHPGTHGQTRPCAAQRRGLPRHGADGAQPWLPGLRSRRGSALGLVRRLYDWSCAWISGLAGTGFIIRCLTFSRPVVDLHALASRNFALGCWFSFVTGVGQFSMIYLIPVFLGSVRGFSSSQIGIAMLSAGVFQLCTIPIYSMFANRVDLRWLLMFGLTCYGISMWLFTFMTTEWGWEEMLWPLAFRGLASPFSSASTVTLTLGGLPPDRLKSASGLFSLMRSLGGAIGIAACGTILNDRTNLHFLRLAEHLTSANAQFMNLLHEITARYTEAC